MQESDTPEAVPPQDPSEPTSDNTSASPAEPGSEPTSFSPEEPVAEPPPTYVGPAVDFGSPETPITPEPEVVTPPPDYGVPGYAEPLPIPPEPSAQVYETPVDSGFGTSSGPTYESPPPPRPDKSAFEAPPPPPPDGGGRNWLLYGLGGAGFLVCALCACILGAFVFSGGLEEGSMAGEDDNDIVATATAREDDPEPTEESEPEPTEESESPPIETESISVFDLETGDCFNEPALTSDDLVDEIEIVDCRQPHTNELFLTVDYPADLDEGYPGEEAIDSFAAEECLAAFATYVGLDYDDSILQVSYFQPTEGTWEEGDREIACFLYEDGVQLEESMQGAER